MVEYEQVTQIGFSLEKDREKQICPRRIPVLPKEILETGAFWHKPEKAKSGAKKPASYHLLIINIHTSIEFIYNWWYELNWDDSNKYRGYWMNPSKPLQREQYFLGWKNEEMKTQTPMALTQYQDRAISSSTQEEPQSLNPVIDEDDRTNKNPARIEALTILLTENPIFDNVTEEVDPAQSRKHYLCHC